MYLVYTTFDSKEGNRGELLDAYRSLIFFVSIRAYVLYLLFDMFGPFHIESGENIGQ